MLSVVAPLTTAFTAPAFVGRTSTPKMIEVDFESKPWTGNEISTEAGMKELAVKLNPTVGFWGARGSTASTSAHAPTPRRRALCRVITLLT